MRVKEEYRNRIGSKRYDSMRTIIEFKYCRQSETIQLLHLQDIIQLYPDEFSEPQPVSNEEFENTVES